MEVETLSEYATSLGTMQGMPIDLGKLAEMEAEADMGIDTESTENELSTPQSVQDSIVKANKK